jgi:hypothetical protein
MEEWQYELHRTDHDRNIAYRALQAFCILQRAHAETIACAVAPFDDDLVAGRNSNGVAPRYFRAITTGRFFKENGSCFGLRIRRPEGKLPQIILRIISKQLSTDFGMTHAF